MGIIYKVPGNLKGPKGTTYSWKNAEEGDNVPDGWHPMLAEALEAHIEPGAKPKRTRRTKAEMEAARENGNE